MNRRCVWMAGLLLLAALSLTGVAQAEWQVGLTHGTDKLRGDWAFPTDNSYHLFSAQNEWEPFQVIVDDEEVLYNVNVAVTSFTGPGDPIEEVELYRVHYFNVVEGEISHFPPDPTVVGWWPDGLVPFVDHFVGEQRDGAPFDVPPERHQAVFVDVFVPAGQTPGDYTATVTVTANDQPTWTGAATLTVWDFALPNSLSLASNYGYSSSGACNYHSGHGGTTSCSQLTQYYYEEFARHRVSLYNWRSGNPTYSWNAAANDFDWDWTAWDAYHAPFFDGTFYTPGYEMTGMRLQWYPGGKPPEVSQDLWEQRWWDGWAEHFRANGWLDKLWYYLPDEPNPDEYPQLAAMADRIHAGDPDLTVLVTEQIEEELVDHVDLWCPDEPMFSDSLPGFPYPEQYDERRALGDQTWWYNCVSANVGYDYANHMIDYDSTYMRIWLWLTRRYHFGGILFWHTIYQYYFANPWETQYIDNWQCQGDGTIIYPGLVDEIGGETDIPVASLRMKYLRESMEDYEYLHILDERGEQEWVDGITRAAAPKTYHWVRDYANLLDWRRKVAEKILGTLDETPPGPPTALQADAAVAAVELSWTLSADADVHAYEIWYGLYEGDRFYGGQVDATVNEAVVTDLMPEREYSLWLTAIDREGNVSVESEVVTAVPEAESDDDLVDDDAADDDRDIDGEAKPDHDSKDPVEKSAGTGCGGRG